MSDIIRPIEPFYLTQGFGGNAAIYAKFGLAGHNGWDFRTKWTSDYKDDAYNLFIKATPYGKRPILASWLFQHYRTASDPGGYGNFFEIVVQLENTWKLTFGHCSSIPSWKTKKEAETMAISGNTGNSTGDHVHLTTKRIKIVNGVHQVLNHSNGYFGAVNPQEFFDELRKYKKENKQPVEIPIKEEPMPTLQVEQSIWETVRNNSESYDMVTDYFGLVRNSHKDRVKEKLDELKKRGDDKEAAVIHAKVQGKAEAEENTKQKVEEAKETIRKELIKILGVGPGETLADVIYMVKTLKQQANSPESENSSSLDGLLPTNSNFEVSQIVLVPKK